ncbi:hypothetical protein RIF29_14130 [Crotalaria pallida]|uniref:Protein DEFECTIVE IN MERISTEM SILENCING 3 n=1 Tax=Crotalaria pallida TaxID=3830 RepID=A0AAN9ICH0_CROPI
MNNPNDNTRQLEENINFLNSLSNQLAESIHGIEGDSGMERITASEVQTIKEILKKEDTAAAILRRFKTSSLSRSMDLPFAKETVGIVATLASVENDAVSRILSEYLGLANMLAIVCKTSEGVKSLEDPFVGGFVPNDPQKKLALPMPRLPNGECPEGFIDYAVNMIHLDHNHVSFVTAGGHGLRETLFYAHFSQVQVYKTRNDMMHALPCIHDGALSLDGGMMKKHGVFSFGSRNDVEVQFPLTPGLSDLPENLIQAEERLRQLQWEKTKVEADVKRELKLLDDLEGTSQGNDYLL